MIQIKERDKRVNKTLVLLLNILFAYVAGITGKSKIASLIPNSRNGGSNIRNSTYLLMNLIYYISGGWRE